MLMGFLWDFVSWARRRWSSNVEPSVSSYVVALRLKMETIARRLLPDVLLFASMDRNPNRLITEQVTRLAAELAPMRTVVRWYQLHEHKFAPSPVR
jgi:hypothetical protein